MDNNQNNWHAYNPSGSAGPTPTRRTTRPPVPRPRIYGCDQCDRAFDRPSALQQHKLTHTGERPHLCSMCQTRRFATASNLYRHMRTCRAAPPASPSPEEEQAEQPPDTDEDAYTPPSTGPLISSQIAPSSHFSHSPISPIYQTNYEYPQHNATVPPGANSDQIFNPSAQIIVPSSSSTPYHTSPIVPSSSGSSTPYDQHPPRIVGNERLYYPHNSYTHPSDPSQQSSHLHHPYRTQQHHSVPEQDAQYLRQSDPQLPATAATEYASPLYSSPVEPIPPYPATTVRHEEYPGASYSHQPHHVGGSNVVQTQSYARNEPYYQQQPPYPTYDPSVGGVHQMHQHQQSAHYAHGTLPTSYYGNPASSEPGQLGQSSSPSPHVLTPSLEQQQQRSSLQNSPTEDQNWPNASGGQYYHQGYQSR